MQITEITVPQNVEFQVKHEKLGRSNDKITKTYFCNDKGTMFHEILFSRGKII